MSSILTNPSALSALQALQMTQNEMQQTQNQVSTGLAVSSAADNASYWSIATQLNSDSGIVTAASQALTQSQSVLATASSAINSVITTISSIQAALTQAENPGANVANLNTTLQALGQQLTQAVSGASFNGINVLDSSGWTNATTGTAATSGTTSTAAANADSGTLSFISGFNASSSGGTFSSVNLSMQALIGGTGGFGILTNQGVAAVAATSTSPAIAAGVVDVTNIDLTNTSAATAMTAVAQALSEVTSYAATLGSTQDQMTAASTFNSALTTNYAEGVSGLVDANMNTASTRLQALQTQEQLGIQSLSIANQNSQLILKLFS